MKKRKHFTDEQVLPEIPAPAGLKSLPKGAVKLTCEDKVVHVGFFKIEVPLAKQWLATQIKNRKVSKYFMQRYEEEHAANKFLFNGETIKFNTNLNLIDAQHRLELVIRTGIPIYALVVFGIPVEAQVTIDMGKSRSVGDLFKMEGFKNAPHTSRIARLLIIWEEKREKLFISKEYTNRYLNNIHPRRIIEFYKEHKGDIDRAASYFSLKDRIIKNMSIPVMGFCFHILKQKNMVFTHEFMTAWIHGALPQGWPKEIKREFMRIRDGVITKDLKDAKGKSIHLNESRKISLLIGLFNHVLSESKEVVNEEFNIPMPTGTK